MNRKQGWAVYACGIALAAVSAHHGSEVFAAAATEPTPADEVNAQIARKMRSGMTHANAARYVLRGFVGAQLMEQEGKASPDHALPAIIAEASRAYDVACVKCAPRRECDRDRRAVLADGGLDRDSPCGARRAKGEVPAGK